jgi:2-C-methyl-D-erythritol 4-phosphate cytidylyltransferase
LTSHISVIIAAAGTGRRFGTQLPKQFTPLAGVPVLARTVEAFDRHDLIDEIVLAVPYGYTGYIQSGYHKITAVLEGGADRQSSVYAALGAVSPQTGIVLVHDGVRPFVSGRLIRNITAAAGEGYAAVAGVRVTDTVKQTDPGGWVVSTPDRDTLWNIQTPQGFPYPVLLKAHERARTEGFTGTDDAMLVERYNLARVRIIEGDKRNIKITEPEDILYGEALCKL